jgi:hypothetical protein
MDLLFPLRQEVLPLDNMPTPAPTGRREHQERRRAVMSTVTDAIDALEEAHEFLDDLVQDGTVSCTYVRQTKKRDAIYRAIRQGLRTLKKVEEKISE